MIKFTKFLNEEKSTKQVAHYQDHPHNGHICENCTMWRPPQGCSAVKGIINPNGWCDYFKRTHKET